MNTILFLEDDEILAESLMDLLEDEGFIIKHLSNAHAVLDTTFDNSFDLYLFDVNVQGMDGFSLLQSLRESDDSTPTIFLTAMSDIASLSKGFDVGADDYIKKPFDFDELLIRIKALLKKSYKTLTNRITIGDFYFDIEKEELYKDDNFIKLSPYELNLAKLFFKNLNQTVQKEFIFDSLGEGKEMSEGALRVHIANLRKTGLQIDTIKGIGYRLASS
jgi:DNA-binding response OmpR family regulator